MHSVPRAGCRFKCDGCKAYVAADKSTRLEVAPNNLQICLKRFGVSNYCSPPCLAAVQSSGRFPRLLASLHARLPSLVLCAHPTRHAFGMHFIVACSL